MQQIHTCFTTRPRQLVEDWCKPFDEAIRGNTTVQVVASVASALLSAGEWKLLSSKSSPLLHSA